MHVFSLLLLCFLLHLDQLLLRLLLSLLLLLLLFLWLLLFFLLSIGWLRAAGWGRSWRHFCEIHDLQVGVVPSSKLLDLFYTSLINANTRMIIHWMETLPLALVQVLVVKNNDLVF